MLKLSSLLARARRPCARWRIGLALFAPLLLGACSSINYYAQAVDGQLGVLSKRKPIAAVLQDPHTSASVKAQLRVAERARTFASKQLHLPDNASYRSYADLGRPYPAWNVVATREFSIQPVQQCYLFVGCMNYRGYFHKAAAVAHAHALSSKGMDVAVVPVEAYSTLGWFDDPIFNSMLNRSEANLVGVIFHELAHQRLYVDGDSDFDESFADFVEREGLRRWFAAQHQCEAYRAYLVDQRRDAAFNRLLLAARARLAHLYGQAMSRTDMLAAKARVFANLKRRYRTWRRHWGGYGGYDRFMARPLNNADLALVATYENRIPAFAALFAKEHDQFPAFYRAAARLGQLPPRRRHKALQALAATSSARVTSARADRDNGHCDRIAPKRSATRP